MLVRVIIAVLLFICLVAVLRQVRTMTKSVERPRFVEAKTARCAHCGVYMTLYIFGGGIPEPKELRI